MASCGAPAAGPGVGAGAPPPAAAATPAAAVPTGRVDDTDTQGMDIGEAGRRNSAVTAVRGKHCHLVYAAHCRCPSLTRLQDPVRMPLVAMGSKADLRPFHVSRGGYLRCSANTFL